MVSIIIPYYNRPQKIKRCVESVLKQTYQDFEILVVDDCSTVPLILDIDSRIRVFRNQKNLGPGLSRNKGLENATGEYVAFLDSDDYWDEKFLESCLKQFSKSPEVSMVYANGFEIDENGEVVGVRRNSIIIVNNILPHILKHTRPWGTGGCLWRNEYLKDVKWQSTISWEDYAFDIDVAIIRNKISGIQDSLVYYDSTGSDKLSNQSREQGILGKTETLLYISSSLLVSDFCNNTEVKESITNQLINGIIGILDSKSGDKSLIEATIKELKKWNGFFMSWYVKLITYFPIKTQLPLLRNLKTWIGKFS